MPKLSTTKGKLIQEEKKVIVRCGMNISLVVLDVPPNVGVSIDDAGVEVILTSEIENLLTAKNLVIADGSK